MDTKALQQKVLDLAIRGKLVPQDPNDEPASVLLERIRAEKAQMVKEGKLKQKDIKNDTIIYVGDDNLHYEKFQDGAVKCIEDEIPFDLPEGWEWARLAGIIELFSGQDLTPDRYNDNGDGIPYITGASNLENGKVIINRWTTTPTTHAIPGDLLLTVKGSGVGKMAFSDIPDSHIARQIMALRCKTGIDKQYLHTVLSAIVADITAQANGIIPGIRREVVLTTIVPVPPCNEQKTIGKQVQTAMSIIDTIEFNGTDLNKIIVKAKAKILNLAIHGQLIPQNDIDESAVILLNRIREEKEYLINNGKLKRDKKESVIFRGDDNSYYEKMGDEVTCIDDEIPFDIPDSWVWCRLENCCSKEIKRGKSPKYTEESNTLVFAQKCNTKYNGTDLSLALCLDESTLSKYPDTEYMQGGDIVINSTGTGTLGRVGIYRDTDNNYGKTIVPDSHVTIVRPHDFINAEYLYAFMKAMQPLLEQQGEGSTNQKELKPATLKRLIVPLPSAEEQYKIVRSITAIFNTLNSITEWIN